MAVKKKGKVRLLVVRGCAKTIRHPPEHTLYSPAGRKKAKAGAVLLIHTEQLMLQKPEKKVTQISPNQNSQATIYNTCSDIFFLALMYIHEFLLCHCASERFCTFSSYISPSSNDELKALKNPLSSPVTKENVARVSKEKCEC